MKKICSIFLLLGCMTAKSQLKLGARAGINLPELETKGTEGEIYRNRQAFCGGLIANFHLWRLFSLQTELNYSPQGGQRKGMQQISSATVHDIAVPPSATLYADYRKTLMLNYLEIPVLIKATLGYKSKVKYYMCMGPQVSILLVAKEKAAGNSQLYLDKNGTIPLTKDGSIMPAVSINDTKNITENIHTVNIGMIGGIGIALTVGRGNIFLESRMNIGLSNIQAHPSTSGENQTGSLAFSGGYIVKIK